MIKLFRKFLTLAGMTSAMLGILQLTSCNNDDEEMQNPPEETGAKTEFVMFSVSTRLPGGTVTFAELDDNSTKVTISLTGAAASANHPAHIHNNSGAEGGAIAISLEPVTGATGKSETIVSMLDDGTVITYQDLIEFDGHVNVHLSAGELGTLVAQGDIGPNVFTANIEDYDLEATGDSGISGDVTFVERVNGEILVILQLENTPAGGDHPAHIHNGSAAVGGGIAISLNPVNGDNGISMTDIKQFDDGTPVSFSDLKEFEGHVKVHLSAAALGTVVASGDIGNNVFTGEMEEYALDAISGSDISGTVTFKERKGGKTLVSIALTGTPDGGSHPAHIHEQSLVEGGSIAIDLNNVNGTTGLSHTDIGSKTYEELLSFDGHIKVHLSSTALGNVVAAGDIGGNALTGTEVSYDLAESGSSGITGSITFSERKNGYTLASITLTGTPQDGDHPAHIHDNDVTTGGGIKIPLNNVNGNTGKSMTQIEKDNGGTDVKYSDLTDYNGHVKVHLSPSDLGTVVSAGNIGSNANNGAKVSYATDIRPILDTNCQVAGCHGSNQSIPSWATYPDVMAKASQIKTKTGNKTMPPASSGKSLTNDQIMKIASWVDDGAPNN